VIKSDKKISLSQLTRVTTSPEVTIFCWPKRKMASQYENYLRGALSKVVLDRSVMGGAN